jgi:hypothetical protein
MFKSYSFYLNQIKKYLRAMVGYPFIRDVSKNRRTVIRKALLIYITKPYRLKKGDPQFLKHQNLKQCMQIVSLLSIKGYSVDLLDIMDDRHFPNENYDLVIGHRVSIREQDIYSTKKNIYLATGTNHKIHNFQVLSRYQYLNERRGIKLTPKNLNSINMPFVEKADAIFCFGNEFVRASWDHVSKGECFSFNNYGFDGTKSLIDYRNLDRARKNFLFFASTNQISKGLDLLLDVFSKNPDLHLYVCSLFEYEKDFCEAYFRELFQTQNIHPVGWVEVNSSLFYKLCTECAFVIHPSCSEGSPGSVIQCMHTGLIPVVTLQTGIDVDDFGILFPSDQIVDIEKTIQTVTDFPIEKLKSSSLQTRITSIEKYSEQSFLQRWKELLEIIS